MEGNMIIVGFLLKIDFNVKAGYLLVYDIVQLNIDPTDQWNIMKKDDKTSKDKMMDRKVRHPTASFSTKSIIMNLVIAFFLYLLRRTIEAGGKSAITKYSKFIK